jgi:hypothetical protein
VREIASKILAGYVKDKDQNLHVFKNVLSLTLKVLLHEHILTSTVPKTQDQVASDFDPALIDRNCEIDAIGVSTR